MKLCIITILLSFSALFYGTNGYPRYFVDDTCVRHPTTGLKKHKPPQVNEGIQFIFQDIDTQQVTASNTICAGKTYNMTITLPFTANIIATSTLGSFSTTSDNTCNNRYYTNSPISSFITKLSVPCTESMDQTVIQVTAATSSSSPFYQNTITLQVDPSCVCVGVSPLQTPAPPSAPDPLAPNTPAPPAPLTPFAPNTPAPPASLVFPPMFQIQTDYGDCIHTTEFDVLDRVECSTVNTTYSMELQSDGWYMLRDPVINKCLDVPWGQTKDNIFITMYDCYVNVDNQKFIPILLDSKTDTYKFLIKHSLKCLDASGTYIMQYSCNESEGQRFVLGWGSGAGA